MTTENLEGGKGRAAPRDRQGKPDGLRMGGLIFLVAMLVIAALIAVTDVVVELADEGVTRHTGAELIATLALFTGIVIGAREIRRSYRRLKRSDAALKMASGAFADLVRERFDEWEFTPSEAEVALLTLKGFDAGEIAAMRGRAAGTVRAQQGRVYAKSGTNGRGGFVSLFIDALLEDPVLVDPDG